MKHPLMHPFTPSIVAVQGVIILFAFAILASIAILLGGGFLSTP
jgi:hypothetical protein